MDMNGGTDVSSEENPMDILFMNRQVVSVKIYAKYVTQAWYSRGRGILVLAP